MTWSDKLKFVFKPLCYIVMGTKWVTLTLSKLIKVKKSKCKNKLVKQLKKSSFSIVEYFDKIYLVHNNKYIINCPKIK